MIADTGFGHAKRLHALWRQRTMVAGLAPIYMKATLQAIFSGPNRKPVYTVTRKHDDLRWHWRETLPQTALLLLVPFVGIYSLVQGTLPSAVLLAGTVYWGGLNIVLLTGFVTRGWHGVFRFRLSVRRARSGTSPAASTETT